MNSFKFPTKTTHFSSVWLIRKCRKNTISPSNTQFQLTTKLFTFSSVFSVTKQKGRITPTQIPNLFPQNPQKPPPTKT